MNEQEVLSMMSNRLAGRQWTIYACAEPDGQDCDAGTHPNILRHRCAALKKWHEWHDAHPNAVVDENTPKGPAMVAFEVAMASDWSMQSDPIGVLVHQMAFKRKTT